MSATRPSQRSRQSGASIITAVFLITAMAVIGALMVRLSVNTNISTAEEYLSAQALYAAETGVDWTAHQIVTGIYGAGCPYNAIPAQPVIANTAWFTPVITGCEVAINGQRIYTITSTGMAGGAPANPMVQRQIVVQFAPVP